ncbi:hypothetical protein HMPREF9577_00496 [Cutibacterium acnes HL110PA3]|nr:hypothetical protein HMPREF9567_00522 [Cutibacterium acnes HL013PA1]EFS40852.1 hypothetical protein HMPREF9575_01431 [Cutibacterium acnes HL110PA1]EFT26782.1 hypothetical protein HMPREF9577_00496 [Cutibacterium acnes HL110PA3]
METPATIRASAWRSSQAEVPPAIIIGSSRSMRVLASSPPTPYRWTRRMGNATFVIE